MTIINITIDGDAYPVLSGSLSCTLQAGMQGTELGFALSNLGVSPPNPASNSKVEIDVGGIDFTGRLGRVAEDTKGRLCKYSCTAFGPQERARRSVSVDYRATSSVSSVLTAVLGGSGLAGSVPDDKDLTGGFVFSGTLVDCVDAICAQARMVSWLAPDGTLYLYDRDNLPAAPFDWEVDDAATLIDQLKKEHQSELPITRTIVHGGVKKVFDGQDDSETQTLAFTFDGVTDYFEYWRETDEITDVRVNGASVTVTYFGSGDEGTVDVVNRRDKYRLVWNVMPADGDELEVDITIQYATAVANDTATQADLVSKGLSEDGVIVDEYQDDNIRTQDQAGQVAAARLAELNTSRKRATAVVYSATLFLPCRKVTVTDPRTFFDYELFVESNSLTWDTGNNRWAQNVTLTNALPSGGGGGGGFARAMAKSYRNAASPPTKPPATETSEATASFTLSIDPTSVAVSAGTDTPAEFEITVTPTGTFTGVVTLSAAGLDGCTFVFDPPTVTITAGAETSTLTVTPTDDEWTDADPDEEGVFTVSGVSGPRSDTVDGEIQIDECGAYAGYTLDVNCSGVPNDCCALPNLYLAETPISVPWSVEFLDDCDPPNVIGTASGTMTIGRDEACGVITTGDEFTDPDDVTHSVWDSSGDCFCYVS